MSPGVRPFFIPLLCMIASLKILSSILEEIQLPYMLSGSVAMSVYAVPRMTRDIDLVIEIQEADTEKLVTALEDHFFCDKHEIRSEIRRQGMFNTMSKHTGDRIDFIVKKNTAYRLEEFNRRQLNHSFGFPVWVVSVEDLILSKLIWIQEFFSDRQAEDIKNLLKTNSVDFSYLLHQSGALRLNTYQLLPHA